MKTNANHKELQQPKFNVRWGKKKYVDRKKFDISRTSSQVHRYSGRKKKRENKYDILH